MKFPRILLLLAVPALHAEDLPPLDPAAVLKELEAIEQKQEQTRESAKSTLSKTLQAAAQSGQAATSFYTDAVKEVDFAGRRDSVVAFNEWRKNNSDLLRSKDLQTAAILYLRYAALSVQRRDAEDPLDFVEPSLNFVGELLTVDEQRGGWPGPAKDLLDKPLTDSVVARWVRLGEWLPDDKSWERTPGNIAGILEKNVRSALRESRDPRLISAWDLQITTEAKRITQGRSEHQVQRFNTIARPRLLFDRAQDLKVVGQPNRAAVEILTLIRAHPDHPDFDNWTEALRQSVTPAPAETSPQ
ncbi:MAG: hypothetical protein SFU53_15955 [Terrimicrobiaceae bacterium]|nr:hypothetical protein [Terrimicrobiaceae bacterium]